MLANKQDLADASTEKDISEILGLARIKERDWAIFKCSAVTGTGLNESLDWIVEKLTPLIWSHYDVNILLKSLWSNKTILYTISSLLFQQWEKWEVLNVAKEWKAKIKPSTDQSRLDIMAKIMIKSIRIFRNRRNFRKWKLIKVNQAPVNIIVSVVLDFLSHNKLWKYIRRRKNTKECTRKC